MTKIEELIDSITINENMDMGSNEVCYPDKVEAIMKQYAEYYVKKTLEMLDLEAEYTDQNCYYDSWVLSDKPSSYKLPDHD